MSKAALVYALAGLVREIRLVIEDKNERIADLERRATKKVCDQPQAHPARCGCEERH